MYKRQIKGVEYPEIVLSKKDWDLFKSSLTRFEARCSEFKPYIPLLGINRSLNLDTVLIAKSFKKVLNSYVDSEECAERERVFSDIMANLHEARIGMVPNSRDLNFEQVYNSIKSLVDKNPEEMQLVFTTRGKADHPTVILVADYHRESVEKGVARSDLCLLYTSPSPRD